MAIGNNGNYVWHIQFNEVNINNSQPNDNLIPAVIVVTSKTQCSFSSPGKLCKVFNKLTSI